ncbi:MAG: membrane protein insertase YidC [Candidatus Nealsonbacteria bacterium]|nr:membrane protein insertase YidC [Candidatus Nealsonbacteria bacterium]
MMIWAQLVDLLQAAIFALSQAFGGNLGMGILSITLLIRTTMLPLTVYLARQAARRNALLGKLKPELDRLRARLKRRPKRLAEETMRVYRREGISVLPTGGLLGMLVQLPVLIALFCAVRRCANIGGRFLWIRNIARPDLVLTALVAALAFAMTALGSHASAGQGKMFLILLPPLMTVLVLWQLSAAIGLHWAASNVVGIVQAVIVRRERSD